MNTTNNENEETAMENVIAYRAQLSLAASRYLGGTSPLSFICMYYDVSRVDLEQFIKTQGMG